MSENTIAKYLDGMRNLEASLLLLGFQRLSSKRKGPLCIHKFIRRTTVIELLFGPPEWRTELVIQTAKQKFEDKDLFAMPAVMDWAKEYAREYKDNHTDEPDIDAELMWLGKLLELVLPLIE
jgi:hypothetical protein